MQDADRDLPSTALGRPLPLDRPQPVDRPLPVEGPLPVDRPVPVDKPLLLLDIDGVISLFGFDLERRPPGSFHSIEGIPHFLSGTAKAHLQMLGGAFELVWASGWEEKANEHLPRLLDLPRPLPYISFDAKTEAGHSMRAHWKLDAVEAYAGQRPLAWVDDAFNEACEEWARKRAAPTLLVPTSPEVGLTDVEAQTLMSWARLRSGV